ncbi:POTE ankyrin domain family member B, partial [Asbolus verrucosus]
YFGKSCYVSNLCQSVSYGLDVVKNVLKQGANIDQLDSNGYSPLACAVLESKIDIVEYLVNQSADVCKVGKKGKTPLLIATEKKNLEIVKLLLDNGAIFNLQSAFPVAIKARDLEIIKYMIEKGALVNFSYKNGYTPLIMAVETGDAAVVKFLIDNGANAEDESVSGSGHTLLTKAATLDNFAMVKHLVENGASVNRFDNNKKTALSIAASNYAFQTIRYLIKCGADPESAKTEIADFASWNDDFATYFASLKLRSKCEETGHDEATQ